MLIIYDRSHTKKQKIGVKNQTVEGPKKKNPSFLVIRRYGPLRSYEVEKISRVLNGVHDELIHLNDSGASIYPMWKSRDQFEISVHHQKILKF